MEVYVQGGRGNEADIEIPTGFDGVLKQLKVQKSRESDPQKDFFEAARKGDVRAMKALLDNPPKGFDINAVDDTGQSALHLASFSVAREAMLRLLVEEGRIDLAIQDSAGWSAFQKVNHYAKSIPDRELGRARDYLLHKMREELMRSLNDRNRSRSLELIKAINFKGEFEPVPGAKQGVTFLAYAAGAGDLETVKAIVEAIPASERAAFINRQGPGGNTALHAAAYAGDLATYDYLKDQGAKDDILNVDEHSPADLLPTGVQRRDGRGPNKPGPVHNPLQIFYDIVRIAFGGTYDWQYGPFRDPPEELDDLPPTGTQEEQARQYAQRFNTALDRPEPVDFDWVQSWEQRAEFGNIITHGSGADRAFMNGRFEDLVTAAGTPTGAWVLNTILDSGVPVHIYYTDQESRTEPDGRGGYNVYLTGRPGTRNNANRPWGSDEGMPTDVILVHELIHVARRILGQDDRYGMFEFGEGDDRIRIPREEAYTVGLGPAALAEIGTENAYRRERGLPERDRYISDLELEDGLWAGIEPAAPDAWWQAYRTRNARPHTHGQTHSHGHGHNHKRDEPGHEMALASDRTYQDKLNSVVVSLAESVDDGKPAPLDEGNLAKAFKDMILYNLFHQVPDLAEDGDYLGRHNFLKRATEKAVNDIKGRIGNVFPDDRKRAKAAIKAVENYLKSKSGKGDAAFVGQQAWVEYTSVTKGLPEPGDPPAFPDFENALNSLVADYARSIDLGARTLPYFKGSYATRFKQLVTHFLSRNFYQFDPKKNRDRWIKKAVDDALDAIKGRLPGAYGDADTGAWALDIFKGYLDRHDGYDHAKALAGEAFDKFAA